MEVPAGQNGFDHDKDKSSGSFALVTGSESVFLYGSQGWPHFVLYLNDVREILAKMLRMGEVIILLNSLFIGCGCLHHAGGEWQRKYCLRAMCTRFQKNWS